MSFNLNKITLKLTNINGTSFSSPIKQSGERSNKHWSTEEEIGLMMCISEWACVPEGINNEITWSVSVELTFCRERLRLTFHSQKIKEKQETIDKCSTEGQHCFLPQSVYMLRKRWLYWLANTFIFIEPNRSSTQIVKAAVAKNWTVCELWGQNFREARDSFHKVDLTATCCYCSQESNSFQTIFLDFKWKNQMQVGRLWRSW